MSELLFVYIDRIYSNVNQQSFNFSNDYNVAFEAGELFIEKNNNNRIPSDFFDEDVKNISLIIGENGIGKSSVLDLISYNKQNRKKLMPDTEFFMIYHIRKDIFYYEGSKGISEKLSDKNRVFNKDSEKLFFKIENAVPSKIVKNTDVRESDELNLSYIRSLPNFHWIRNEEPDKQELNRSEYIKRNYKYELNVSDIYEFLTDNKGFLNHYENIAIEFKQNKQYSTNSSYILFYIYHGNLKLLDEIDYKWTALQSLESEDDRVIKREEYLRSAQDRLYTKYTKQYFILRLMEKDLISIFDYLIKNTKLVMNNNIDLNNLFNLTIDSLEAKDRLWEIESKIIYLQAIYEEILSLDLTNFNSVKTNVMNKKRIENFKELIEQILHLSDDKFDKNNSLVFNLEGDQYYRSFLELFNFQDSGLYRQELKLYLRNLSAGEKVYINTFSLIYHHLKLSSNNIILILDEPDLNFHPEWSRKFIDNLLKIINRSKYLNGSKNIQIIITSHSPFLMTDIPRQNIFLINNSELGKIVKKADTSFAANLYDLVANSFFLKYPIGEFSRKKLKDLSQKKSFDMERFNIIELIDDPLLKKLMMREYRSKETDDK